MNLEYMGKQITHEAVVEWERLEKRYLQEGLSRRAAHRRIGSDYGVSDKTVKSELY
jgi:hypothetical protein